MDEQQEPISPRVSRQDSYEGTIPEQGIRLCVYVLSHTRMG